MRFASILAVLAVTLISCHRVVVIEEGIRVDVTSTNQAAQFHFRSCRSGEPIDSIDSVDVLRDRVDVCKVIRVEGDADLGPTWTYGTFPDGYRGDCRPLAPGDYWVGVSGAGRGDRKIHVTESGEVIPLDGQCVRRREVRRARRELKQRER